jgi:hypothetical protein
MAVVLGTYILSNGNEQINDYAIGLTLPLQMSTNTFNQSYDNLLIPIYPIAINSRQMNIKFKLLDISDMSSLDKYIIFKTTPSNNILKTKLSQYNYKISKIFL